MSEKYLKRYEAVFLVHHPKGPKLTYKSAAKHIKMSESFVKKWVKRFLEVGNVNDLPERGSGRTTTEQEDRAIIRLFQDTPGLSLRTAQLKLRKKGIDISINTIRSRMRENDISFRSTLKNGGHVLVEQTETRRRQQVEAAEKRRTEEASRGVKDPEKVKRMLQKSEEMEKRERELEQQGGATLKWTSD